MKISVNWLKEFISLDNSAEEIADRLTLSGLEVEGVEKVEQIKGGLEGLVIGEVLSAEKHPDADRLKVTKVNIGEAEPVPIVCGAPNVAGGQKVVVAKVDSMLYPVNGDPFKIKKAKIRGQVSEGMICAEDEIGLGTSHDGILVLNTRLPNGTPAAEYFNIQSDTVLEIGLTPNRADAASHLGVARDLKALYRKEIQYPSIDDFKVDNHDLPIGVVVENTEACPRYSGLTLTGITVKPSPDWLQARLKSIGVAPINNIVDVTNFVLHELGQPLHAFDAEAITGSKVVVKTLPADSVFTTLDEKERKLTAEDLMICNMEEGMCIAGVFGGVKSGIKENTSRVFLESAYFSPEYIRRTSQYHGLKTDASFRYERGADPNITVYALKRAALLMKELAGGTISSEIVDVYPEPVKNFEIELSYHHVNRLIGKTIDPAEIREILSSLDIEVAQTQEEKSTVTVPPYRVDVQREADIVEEILRIYGYDHVETADHLSADYLASFPETDPDIIQGKISEMLIGNGFYEMITNSLTKPAYNKALPSAQVPVPILNKLSEDLGELRQSLLFTGLEVIARNINHRQKNLKLFEFGTTYGMTHGKYLERKELAVFMTGLVQAESWMRPSEEISFHHLSSIILKIFNRFDIKDPEQKLVEDRTFHYGLQYSKGEELLAKAGMVDKQMAAVAGVKEPVFYAVIQWPALLSRISRVGAKERLIYQEISKFPEVRRDLSLVLHEQVQFSEVERVAKENSNHLVKDINVFDLYAGENIGSGKKAYALSFILQDQHKTLTDKVIDNTMSHLIHVFEQELGAVIRK